MLKISCWIAAIIIAPRSADLTQRETGYNTHNSLHIRKKYKKKEKVAAVIGGFPHGIYIEIISFRVGDVELTAWATAMEVLCWYSPQ